MARRYVPTKFLDFGGALLERRAAATPCVLRFPAHTNRREKEKVRDWNQNDISVDIVC